MIQAYSSRDLSDFVNITRVNIFKGQTEADQRIWLKFIYLFIW